MLGEYDTDKDGFISLSEFIGDVRGDGKTTDVILKDKTTCLSLVSSSLSVVVFSFATFILYFVISGIPLSVGD